MTDLEADQEAKRRWGEKGLTTASLEPKPARYYVGEAGRGWGWIKGQGDTWEAAFADADRKGAGEGG